MTVIKNKPINIFQIELERLSFFLTKEFLNNLLTYNGAIFGKKMDNYYILNTNRVVNNFQNTNEVENFNIFLNCCLLKGFSLAMIKF